MRAARQSRRIMRPRGRIACIDWQPKKFGSAGDEPARMSSSCCSCAAAEFGSRRVTARFSPSVFRPTKAPSPNSLSSAPCVLNRQSSRKWKQNGRRASSLAGGQARPSISCFPQNSAGTGGLAPNEQKQPARERSQSASAHLHQPWSTRPWACCCRTSAFALIRKTLLIA